MRARKPGRVARRVLEYLEHRADAVTAPSVEPHEDDVRLVGGWTELGAATHVQLVADPQTLVLPDGLRALSEQPAVVTRTLDLEISALHLVRLQRALTPLEGLPGGPPLYSGSRDLAAAWLRVLALGWQAGQATDLDRAIAETRP